MKEKNRCTMEKLSLKYNVTVYSIQYLCCLIDEQGFNILRITENRYYLVYVK